MAESAAATSKTLATAKQYNDLRNDVLSTTLGHMHDGTNARVHTDDTIFALGTDKDIALVSRSTTLAANTALTGVLVGTPVTPAVAANSLILANITASGDILIAGNLGGNSRAYLFADVSADTLDLMTAGLSRLFLAAAGLVAINDTTNANMTIGLTINGGANDNQHLALKNSDVATGLTTATSVNVETDDFFTIQKYAATEGGARIMVLCENADVGGPLGFFVYGSKPSTAKTISGALPMVEFYVAQHDGANALANIDADGDVWGVRCRRGGSNVTLLMVDEDADLFAGVANTVTALTDDYDDAHLVRAYAHALEGGGTKGLIRSRYDSLVRYNERDLVEAGVLGATIAEGGMWNMSQHLRVLTGAAWQARVRDYQLEERLELLGQEVLALRGELMMLKGG